MIKAARVIICAWVPLVLAAWSGEGRGDPDSTRYGAGHAVPTLLAESGFVREETTFLGLHFEIEPGWHLYWKGWNDTGFPPTIETDFPPGCTPGEILWPAPERHISPGRILDHVYFGNVTLLIPVGCSREESSGDSLTFTVTTRWLACRDICLPGEATVRVTMPVAGPGVAPGATDSTARTFREARARIPEPVADPHQAGIEVIWHPDRVQIEVTAARRLAFFPGSKCARLSHVIEDGVSETGRLDLRLGPTERGHEPLLSGVLEIQFRNGTTRFLALEVLRPASP